jgi:hypothetical protein
MIMGLFPNEDPQKRFAEMMGRHDPMTELYMNVIGSLVIGLAVVALFLLLVVPRGHNDRDEPNENDQRNRIRGM